MLQRQNISLTITGIEVLLMFFVFHLCLDSKRLISKTIAMQQNSFFLSVAHIHATLIGLCLTSYISFFKSKSALELSNLSWWPRLALPCCIWPPPFFALFPNEFGQGAFFPSLTALFTFGLFDRLVRLHTKGEDHKLKIPFFQPVQPSSWFHDWLGGIEKMKSPSKEMSSHWLCHVLIEKSNLPACHQSGDDLQVRWLKLWPCQRWNLSMPSLPAAV